MTTESQNPTVILVHGAFADASSWARVLERVRDAGIAVEAIPNPLRGLTADESGVLGTGTSRRP
jgi:pimeloyl-ACP methyl ester carboxylesterase